MARFDLTDAEWAVIEPLLPTDVRGKERVISALALDRVRIVALRSHAAPGRAAVGLLSHGAVSASGQPDAVPV
ncbi:transposase [Methylorubrum thiocyanatum]|uniref:Transposase n=1 Tax=Methylorubrum thiocyanatum TaxID=47958 RepID=A0AA40S496_9HYPH|nr:transposase [Methylorubrum thiocyanatum]GJE79113.1 hypothetical protein CJNNKLLH_0438 [Methylorubrum thiocyanatum]